MCLYSGKRDISIRMVDRMDFRRSLPGEKDKQVKTNPELVDESSDKLRKQLERLGFMRGKDLIIDKFFIVSKKTFPLNDLTGLRVNIRLEKTKEYGDWRMNVIADYDSTGIRLDYGTAELRYIISDIVPGGFSEVIVLKEHQDKQGYNFDLLVYEIRL
jgi:hypothetical protein